MTRKGAILPKDSMSCGLVGGSWKAVRLIMPSERGKGTTLASGKYTRKGLRTEAS